MTIRELLKIGVEELKKESIEDYILKSRILLSFFLNEPKEYLIIHDDITVSKNIENKYFEGIERLKMNVPIQYITNEQEFMKMKFYVDENVLIPRSDTEILVEEVIRLCKNNFKILDLCSGSGAIGISIKKYKADAEVYLADISKSAIEISKKNSYLNNCKMNFINSDLFDSITERDFDIIVSNPPYISESEMNSLELQVKKEPVVALYGGIDGLDFYKKIIKEAKNYLKKDGYLCFEIGYKQKESVMEIFRNNGYSSIYCIKDLSGNDRVVIGKMK